MSKHREAGGAAGEPGSEAEDVHVSLGGGRRLSYSESGPRDGFPVLYLHGAIGSPMRRDPELERVLARLGIRWLMVSRPGFGGSTPLPGRSISQLPADIAAFADSLALRRLSIVGVSAGAPYALACAAAIPERIQAVAAVSSAAPGLSPHELVGMSRRYRAGLALLTRIPDRARRLGDGALDVLREHPELIGRMLAFAGSGRDCAEIPAGQAREMVVRSLLGACERGVGPMIDDYLASCRPWGFEPEAIEIRCVSGTAPWTGSFR